MNTEKIDKEILIKQLRSNKKMIIEFINEINEIRDLGNRIEADSYLKNSISNDYATYKNLIENIKIPKFL